MPFRIDLGSFFPQASGGGGGGSVNSVSGTTGKITVTGTTDPVVTISSSYVGQTSITTLGTIAAGTWNGTAIGASYVATLNQNTTGSSASCTGNAATVTNGVYTTDSGTVTNTMLAGSIDKAKITNTAVTLSDTQTLTNKTLTSATFTAPLLGTPFSGNLSNCTGYTDANLSTSNVTTNNASTSKHGFVPILPNDATKYYDGTGAYSVPPGNGGADVNGNITVTGGFIEGYTVTTGSGGTLTLTVSSTETQRVISSSHTIKMPVTSTLTLGQSFDIISDVDFNNSLLIQSSGGNTLTTLYPGDYARVVCILTSGTSAASWLVVTGPFSSNKNSSVYGPNARTTTNGTSSLAVGASANAGANSTIALGASAAATGTSSLALGAGATANNTRGVALGSFATSGQVDAIALGGGSNSTNAATASGINSIAIGKASVSNSTGSCIINDSTSGNAASATNEMMCTFAGGFRWSISSTVVATQIDTTGNFIAIKGTADQSFSKQVPTTGFSITIGANVKTLILDPAGTLASGTITMPASPINGQEIRICSSQIITSLTVSANSGQSIEGTPSTLGVGGGFGYIYVTANTAWYRLY